jgi:hypothetical protein
MKKENTTVSNIKKKNSLEQLIETIVLEVLAEQDIVADDPLVRVFISPFMDIVKTAKGEAEKLTARAWSNISSLAKQAAVLAIPFLASSTIKEIQEASNKKLEQRLSTIDAEYADVLKRNWDNLRSRDVWGITFLLNPTLGIAEKFLMKAPYHGLGILEVLSGRNPKVTALRNKAKILATHVSPNYSGGGGGSADVGGYGGGGYDDMYGGMDGLSFADSGVSEGIDNMLEQQQPAPQAQPQQPIAQPAQPQTQVPQKKMISQEQFNKFLMTQIAALKKDPQVQASLQSSKVIQQMQASAFESVLEAANPILKATNYQQLKGALGQDFGKFESQLQKTLPPGATPEQQKEFQEALVPEIKAVYKQMLISQLQKQIGYNKSIAKPMQNLITKINRS